jgi:hypothetical protein
VNPVFLLLEIGVLANERKQRDAAFCMKGILKAGFYFKAISHYERWMLVTPGPGPISVALSPLSR